jgi:hypothetical protein
LGDGHLVTAGEVPILRISCADAWPGLIGECGRGMLAVLGKGVQRVQKSGVSACSAIRAIDHAYCRDTGPGRKHERPIYLAD